MVALVRNQLPVSEAFGVSCSELATLVTDAKRLYETVLDIVHPPWLSKRGQWITPHKPSVHAILAHAVPHALRQGCEYHYQTDAHEGLVAKYRRLRQQLFVQETGERAGRWREAMLIDHLVEFQARMLRDKLQVSADRETRKARAETPHVRRAVSAARAALTAYRGCMAQQPALYAISDGEEATYSVGDVEYRYVPVQAHARSSSGGCTIEEGGRVWNVKRILRQKWTLVDNQVTWGAEPYYQSKYYDKMVRDVSSGRDQSDNGPDDESGEANIEVAESNPDEEE